MRGPQVGETEGLPLPPPRPPQATHWPSRRPCLCPGPRRLLKLAQHWLCRLLVWTSQHPGRGVLGVPSRHQHWVGAAGRGGQAYSWVPLSQPPGGKDCPPWVRLPLPGGGGAPHTIPPPVHLPCSCRTRGKNPLIHPVTHNLHLVHRFPYTALLCPFLNPRRPKLASSPAEEHLSGDPARVSGRVQNLYKVQGSLQCARLPGGLGRGRPGA